MNKRKTSQEESVVGKVVVLGDQGVGKTSLVLRYIEEEYNEYVSPTIGASYFSCSFAVQNLIVKLQIWDTAGQERYRAMAPMFYRHADAALVVYDIAHSETFVSLKNWVKEIKKNTETSSIILCIIGSKSDLDHKRKVSRDEAAQYAESIGADYYEISALLGEGINEIFENIASSIAKTSREELIRIDDEGRTVFASSYDDEDDDWVIILKDEEKRVIKSRRKNTLYNSSGMSISPSDN